MDTDSRNDEILCPLREGALKEPGAPAVVGVGGKTSYAELDARVSAAARRLRDMGCEAGTRVALHLTTDERYLVILLALFRLGAVASPVSTRLPPRGVSSLVRRAGCSILVSEDESLTDAVSLDDLLLLESSIGTESEPSDRLWLPLDRDATVVFTSGSSGSPKAALHTLGNHYYSALGSRSNIELSGGDRWLLSLPLYHVGGLSILFRCLLAGATIVIPEPGASLGRSIPAFGITHLSLVATQLKRLLEERVDLGGLKAILLGGGPIPGSLVDEAVSRNLPFHTSYGLTEMSSQATTTPPGATSSLLHTAGRVLPHREVSIAGDGEVLVRGETLFAGYIEEDGLNRAIDEAGWFHTGDLGELDDEGYLRILGRKDNLFVSGGENVQPEEIEETLGRLASVERAVVAPAPDVNFGERPVAFVLAADDSVTPDILIRELGDELPRFKIPVAFYEWPEDADPGKVKVDRPFFRDLALRMLGGT
ncbi:o-succinylbenzoate--CoA ligase [soil metagenome]